MLTVLKHLQVATTALCEAETVSTSMVYPVINGLLNKHLVVTTDDLQPVKAFKQIVSQEIKCHFIPDSLEIIDKPPIIATAVDARYYQLQCFSDRQRALI